MTGEIIPFSKYRGQPIEVLQVDRQYAEWLVAQQWFRERFVNIYNVVVNKFTTEEAAETPEHNSLQVLFLDKMFLANVVEIAFPGLIQKILTDRLASLQRRLEYDLDALENNGLYFRNDGGEKVPTLQGKDLINDIANHRERLANPIFIQNIQFEVSGADVAFEIAICGYVGRYSKANEKSQCNILFTERYIGVGATLEQFVKTFELSGIRIVFRNQIPI